MTNFLYSVVLIPRNPDSLQKELNSLNNRGFELVTILEYSLEYSESQARATKPYWVVVTKKVA